MHSGPVMPRGTIALAVWLATIEAFAGLGCGTGTQGAPDTGTGPGGVAPSPGGSTGEARIYWGAYIDGNDTYGPPYVDAPWDSTTWSLFESHAGKRASIVHWGLGAPWERDFEYWRNTFDLVRNAGALSLVDMQSRSVPLRDIANGLYDRSLETWVREAAAWGHPFFLRFDWEMNGGWFSWGTTASRQNSASDYVNAWRHFHDLADRAGAGNINWVWCPNVDPDAAFTPFGEIYPGDTYVDWTCLDGYNRGGAGWMSFDAVFASSYDKLLRLAPSKPIMIGETSSEENGGSKATWISDALTSQLPGRFRQVKAFVWFNWRIYENDYWWPWPIESSASAQAAFASGISSSRYVPGGSFASLPPLSKIAPP